MFTGAQLSPLAFYSSGSRPLSCSPQSRVGGEEEERSIWTPFVGKAPFSFSRGRAKGGIGGELRKLLSLSLFPLMGRPGSVGSCGKREREERFFKRAADVGAAVWLCPALEGQGSFGGSRIL